MSVTSSSTTEPVDTADGDATAHRAGARVRRDPRSLFAAICGAVAVASALLGAVLPIAPAVVLALTLGLLGACVIAGAVRRTERGAVDVARARLLEAERARHERLLEELSSAVVLFDAERVTHANRAARRMFGMPANDAPAGTSPLHLPTDEGTQSLLHAVEEARAVKRAVDLEVQRDAVDLAAHAVELGGDQAALIVRDVTPERRLAAVRRDFVVNASHELKTPVAGIQALAESLALALRHDPARGARMVERIEQEAGRLARLVRELLDLARLEEAESSQEPQPVDVVRIVGEQIDRLQAAAVTHEVGIAASLPKTAVVVASREDVRTIVANLLENAVRYNRPGGTVTVEVARRDSSVTLEVRDTGEGIAVEDRERIFERFYRVDRARSRAAGGTGLGLSIVRHAIHRLGGTIVLHSELGVGSTFRVELPVAQD